MTCSPLATAASDIPVHGVTGREIVPRANELHGFDRGVSFTIICQISNNSQKNASDAEKGDEIIKQTNKNWAE